MTVTPLPRRALGRTGHSVTTVSLGGVGLGGKGTSDLYGGIDDATAIAAVHAAVRRGINYIDTSPLYAESERRIGLALEALSEAEREGLLIGSKVGDECPPYSDNGGHSAFSYEGVMSSVQHSLKQLRVVKRLDTVLVHDPTGPELEEFLTPKTGGMQALIDLKEKGVVGAIGIGCLEHEHHIRFLEGGLGGEAYAKHAEVVLSVNDYNLARRYGPEGSWVNATQRGAGVINAGVYYMGLLADPEQGWARGFLPNLQQPKLVELARRMGRWCAERGLPIKTLALKFSMAHPAVASCPIGCRTPAEVDEVVDSALCELPEGTLEAFEEEFGAEVRGMDRSEQYFYNKSTTKIGVN